MSGVSDQGEDALMRSGLETGSGTSRPSCPSHGANITPASLPLRQSKVETFIFQAGQPREAT